MSYDIDYFKREKKRIIKKCKSIKSLKKQIKYLIQERIDFQQKLSEEGEPSMFCDTFADTATPQGGGDNPLIRWLFNETERRRVTLQKSVDKPEWNITKIDDVNPNAFYPRKVIAKIKEVTPRNVEYWIKIGVIGADGKRIYLKDTQKKNAKPILGQDFLNFEDQRYNPTK